MGQIAYAHLLARRMAHPAEMHAEMPGDDDRIRFLQLWISLASEHKLCEQVYQDGKPRSVIVKGVTANMARPPQGNDRDQVRSVALGLGELAVVNTYYLGLLENADDPKDRAARAAVGVIFPNQSGRGAHVNVSGAGIVKGAKNRPHAVALLEFLTSKKVQAGYQKMTSEFAVAKGIKPEPLQEKWGTFNPDLTSLHELAKHQEEAVKIFDLAGWK